MSNFNNKNQNNHIGGKFQIKDAMPFIYQDINWTFKEMYEKIEQEKPEVIARIMEY